MPIIQNNTCPELNGPTDSFGNTYAGPRCDGCTDCAQYEAVKLVLRTHLPYKQCFWHGDHQLMLCSGEIHQQRATHWYCADMANRPHSSPTGEILIIEEDFPDEALET